MSIEISDFLQSSLINDPFYVLLGEKTDYSHSPLIHNTALEYHGVSATYYALNISRDEISKVFDLFDLDTFKGCNITIPYKKTFIDNMDTLSKEVRDAGAMNTIRHQNNTLEGFNTDIYGFLTPLESYVRDIKTPTALILGSGGAARAAILGLKQLGFPTIYMASRNPETISNPDVNPISYNQLGTITCDVVINATPLGMSGQEDQTPLTSNQLSSLEASVVYDLIYNPSETKLLQIGRKLELPVLLNGLPMLVYQAGKSFELWTEKEFPFDIVFDTVKQNVYES